MFPFNLFKNKQKEEKLQQRVSELKEYIRSIPGFETHSDEQCMTLVKGIYFKTSKDLCETPEYKGEIDSHCLELRLEQEEAKRAEELKKEEERLAELKKREEFDIALRSAEKEAEEVLQRLTPFFHVIGSPKGIYPNGKKPSCLLIQKETFEMYDFEYDAEYKVYGLTSVKKNSRIFPV